MLSLPPSVVDLVGYAAAACTTAAWIPQVVRTWRSRSADDLSFGMLLIFTSGVLLWLIFGLALGSRPIIAANGVTFVLSLVLVGLRLRFGGQPKP